MSNCQVFQLAGLIGKKWTIALMQEVSLNGDKGFNFISRRMKKITPKILSARLREMEGKGIVKREIFNKHKIERSRYTLTEKGKELQSIIENLKVWNMKYSGSYFGCNDKKCIDCKFYYL